MVTSTDIVNQAIQLIGDDQPPVTGTAPTFDSSPAGQAAAKLYVACVATVTRQFAWDFARSVITLNLNGGGGGVYPWTYEFVYPASAVEVLQLMDTGETDHNNPAPKDWSVGNQSSVKVIWTNIGPTGIQAVILNTPNENLWDAIFRESVVRLLASELAIALEGRPDTARDQGGAYERFSNLGTTRQD